MDIVGALFLLVVLGVVAAIAFGGIALARWAIRTGRRPWLWVLAAYVAGNILWAILRPLVTRP
jgi:hypothetical protein